MKQRITYCC